MYLPAMARSVINCNKSPFPLISAWTFLGNVAYQALPEIYGRAGIFVFPTLADTWGVVVNEALAAGLPVLGSVSGQAVSELVIDGQNGWTFHPDHPGSMAAALERCLETPTTTLDDMRRHARRTAMQLTPDYLCDRIADAILTCRNATSA